MSKSSDDTGSRRVRRKPAGRAGLSGITVLGAFAMLMIGAGLGAAAALSASPAGASTAHSSLPPVNVSVQNTPTVNVGNLPLNSAGRLKVTSGGPAGTALQSSVGPWAQANPGQTLTVANVSGSGTFTGLTARGSANGSPEPGIVSVIADGSTAFSWNIGWCPYTGPAGALIGLPSSGMCIINYFPPEAISFQKSLVVVIQNYTGATVWYWSDVWYTTNS